MYKRLIRPFLFLFDAERIHDTVVMILKLPLTRKVLNYIFDVRELSLPQEIAGLIFRNPIGLAAGFDKNAELIDTFAAMGFGFVEIGTVTPKEQEGNPKPRLFRLKKDKALINRMGFNNAGVEQIRTNILKSRHSCLIGGNIGKNRDTPNEQAVADYEICFKRLADVVDYFVVNVSSPNTPGLRQLQEARSLKQILQRLQELNQQQPVRRPIFLKIAPDLTTTQLDEIITVVVDTKISGIIATNTTILRENLKASPPYLDRIGEGGLSGKPLADKTTGIIRYIIKKSERAFHVIGVGGIHSPTDALAKFEAGASLIQLYTGFIYEGPGLIRSIIKKLRSLRSD